MKRGNNKISLGRGLASLLPDGEIMIETSVDQNGETNFIYIELEFIKPNPYQPRQAIPLSSVIELSDSIKEKGVLQPITVIKEKTSGGYVLVAGERRLQAAKLAGLEKIPAIVGDFSDQDLAEIAIIENLHRKNLNPIEESYAFLRLNKEFGLTFDQIAQRVSKNPSYIDNKIRLSRLPKLVQNAISVGDLTEKHGHILLGLEDEQAIIAALKIIIRNNLSTKKTEELIRDIKRQAQKSKKFIHRSPTMEWEDKYSYITDFFKNSFGLDVQLRKAKGDGGRLMINFNNDDELISFYTNYAAKSRLSNSSGQKG